MTWWPPPGTPCPQCPGGRGERSPECPPESGKIGKYKDLYSLITSKENIIMVTSFLGADSFSPEIDIIMRKVIN